MNTLSPHLTAMASLLAIRHPGTIHLALAPGAAGPATGGMTLILFVLLISAVTGAARSVAAVIGQFLRLAAAMMSILLTAVIAVTAIVIVVALMIQH